MNGLAVGVPTHGPADNLLINGMADNGCRSFATAAVRDQLVKRAIRIPEVVQVAFEGPQRFAVTSDRSYFGFVSSLVYPIPSPFWNLDVFETPVMPVSVECVGR